MGILDSITLRLASSDSVSVRIAIAPTRRLATSGFLVSAMARRYLSITRVPILA